MTWAKLEAVFEELGLPYSRQGSYSDEGAYPPSFYTFWNFDTPSGSFYDNDRYRTEWVWLIGYYTNNPATLYSGMEDFIGVAYRHGFIIEGMGSDARSDRPDYYGRTIKVIYIEWHD